VVGAYYVFLTRNEWLLGQAGQAMTSSITQTMLFNVFLGTINPVVDNWGHFGGLLGGAAMAYYFGPRLYLAEFPSGGRIAVDRPIVRLPRHIESIPENVSDQIKRITRRMKVQAYKADMPARPWQQRQKWQRMRQATPNRSIKPGPVDW
jgi:Rhomboid family